MIHIDRKALRLYALAMLPVVIAMAWFVLRSDHAPETGVVRVSPRTIRVAVGGREFSAEVADTPSSRELGLGNRDSLCDSCAMLFRFDMPGEYGFWMKGMRFPLDITWIRDGRIVHIEREVSPEKERVMHPGTTATEVLETNAGALSESKEGDAIEISAS